VSFEIGCGRLQNADIDKLLSFTNSDFVIIDSKAVCGEAHLVQVAKLALLAHEGKYNLSKDKSTEVLLYLTAQRQISKALKLVGINKMTTTIAWISFSKVSKRFLELVTLDETVISHEKFDYSRFGINPKFSLQDKQKIVMARAAVLPVQSR